MNISSLLRSLRKKFFTGAAPRRKPFRRYRPLELESLEMRTAPAVVAPKIISESPANLFVWDSSKQATPSPDIFLTFNEKMYNPSTTDPHSVTNPANYSLFSDITGASFKITQVTYTANSDGTSTVKIIYNRGPGNVLPDGTYTLFAQGADLFESTNTLSLAPPGQLVTINPQTGTVSTINTTPNGGLAAASSYSVRLDSNTPAGGTETPIPVGIAIANINGDKDANGKDIMDLAIAFNLQTSTGTINGGSVEVFLGQQSGGFSLTPDATLYFDDSVGAPAANWPSTQRVTGIVAADVGQFFVAPTGLPDLVAIDSSGRVNTFENDTTPGSSTLNFASSDFGFGQNIANADPVGIVSTNIYDFTALRANNVGAQQVLIANGQQVSGSYVVTILTSSGQATFNSLATISVAALTAPSGIAVANFNGDKLPDFVVSGSNGVLPFLNTTSGGVGSTPTFKADGQGGTTTPLAGTATFGAVAAGTLTPASLAASLPGLPNIADIAAISPGATPTSNATLYVFANDGTGKFSNVASSTFTLDGAAQALSIQDLNGDGLGEILAVANNGVTSVPSTSGNSALELLLNTSTSTGVSFATTVDYLVDSKPVSLAVGDLNNDGNADVVTVAFNTNGPSFSVVYGNGDGTLAALTSANLVNKGSTAQPAAVASGDLNGDGIPDLVVADAATSKVEVYLGQAGGGYLAATGSPYSTLKTGTSVGGDPVSVVLADLTGKTYANGLPILDIVTADDTPDSGGNYYVSVIPNKGDGSGTFNPLNTNVFQVGQSPTQVAAGLFSVANGKTAQDLVVAHNGVSSRGVSLLINSTLAGGAINFNPFVEVPITANTSTFNPTAIAVADFNNDKNLDFVLLNTNPQQRSLYLAEGDGKGGFTVLSPYSLSPNIGPPSTTNFPGMALAVGDFNRDTFPDVVVVGQAINGSTAAVETFLNNRGFGFQSNPVISTTPMPGGATINSVAVTDINDDAFPDLVVGTVFSRLSANAPATIENLIGLQGQGDGTFANAIPYEAPAPPASVPGLFTQPNPIPVPQNVTVVSDSFLPVLTFFQTGPLVTTNLIVNGRFSTPDLNGDVGTLTGWQTATEKFSQGEWVVQKKSTAGNGQGGFGPPSPLSGIDVINPPVGQYQAMLDEYDLIQYKGAVGVPNPNVNPYNGSYSGTNFLYQVVTLPSSASQVTLSMDLFLDNIVGATGKPQGKWFTPSLNPLDFNQSAPDKEVLVDFIAWPPPSGTTDIGTYLIGAQSLPGTVAFQTLTTTASVVQPLNGKPNVTLNLPQSILSQFAGKTIALRIAAVNNQPGQLIVGVDDVQLNVSFSDANKPTLTNLQLRNPGETVGTGANALQTTTDPTITGRVGDDGGVGAITAPGFVQVTSSNTNLPNSAPVTTFVTQFDAQGNFAVALPNLASGKVTVTITVQNSAGSTFTKSLTFFNQGPSVSGFQASGPGSVSTAGAVTTPLATVQGNQPANISYTSVSGRVTTVVSDPSDPAGTTLYAGSENGGVWKSLDDGANWTPLTDFVINQNNGQPINVPVGAIAVSKSNSKVVYVATGDNNILPDSQGSVGILVSTNGGQTWTVVGRSDVLFANARIMGMVVDQTDPNIVYVAVASGASGPGVFRTLNGLSANPTWTNILTPSTMTYPDYWDNSSYNGTAASHTFHSSVGAGASTPLASVTSLSLDPFNPQQLVIGMGNIGLVPDSPLAGVWISANANNPAGATWTAMVGGNNQTIPRNDLPFGTTVGRVTVAEGLGVANTEPVFYVLVANPTTSTPVSAGSENFGDGLQTPANVTPGLYKTSDHGLDFTHVQVNTLTGFRASGTDAPPIYTPVSFGAQDAGNVGGLVVDASNPNVVYVGGSVSFDTFYHSYLDRGLIAVNTGDMLDARIDVGVADWLHTGSPIFWENSGDDYQKVLNAYSPAFGGKYDGPNGDDPYLEPGWADIGEGVSWYDITDQGYMGANAVPLGSLHPGGQRSVATPYYNPALGVYLDPIPGGGTTIVDPYIDPNPAVPATTTLPSSVLHLGMDGQGRLLVGTETGVFRVTVHSIGYDFTSQQNGIMSVNYAADADDPLPANFTIDTLNGNMQITDLTSVAIDPSSPATLYAAGYGVGLQRNTTNGLLSWQSMLTNGPYGQVDAGTILAAPSNPAAPAGTPTTLYVNWSFINQSNGINALNPNPPRFVPQFSTQGGAPGTFQIKDAGISTNDDSPLFPLMVVDPNIIPANGVNQAELLFGTSTVYLTRTGSNTWNRLVSGGQPLKSGSLITAAAVAPSNSGFFYAGTDHGEVFVSKNNGVDGWTEIDSGLPAGQPGATITNFSVDPNNPNIVFVTIGGTGTYDHVWMSTTAGASWTDIQGDLPVAPALSIVTDPRPQPAVGAPLGHLYVGTTLGVFVSVDNGAHWARLGHGVPNVPVVTLNFNQKQEELVAATQGRGVFLVSTDTVGPHVVSSTPTNPVGAEGISSVTVTFNEAIGSFPLSAVTITGPNGAITPTSVFDISTVVQGLPNPHNVFQINFPLQTADGTYTITLGPGVTDLIGNPIDQDLDGFNGTEAADNFTLNVVVNTTDDGRFVSGLYHDLLNEIAPLNGFLNLLNTVDAGRFAALRGLANNFVASNAARAQLITNLYQSTNPSATPLGFGNLLGRAPGADLGVWLGQLAAGASVESIVDTILSWKEFFNQPSVGGTDAGFLNQLYTVLLNRAPSTNETNAFLGQLSGAERSARLQVAVALANSGPYFDNFVTSGYSTYLGVTSVNPALVSTWESLFLNTGLTQQQFIAMLMGTRDYYVHAPTILGLPSGTSATNTTFVQAVYQQLFGGTPSPALVNTYLNLLAQLGQQQFAALLLATPDYLVTQVNQTYSALLLRSPTGTEINSWVTALLAGYPLQDMTAVVTSYAEYFNLPSVVAGATTLSGMDTNWIAATYSALIGSTIGPDQSNNLLNVLQAAERNARFAVAQTVTSRPGYRTRVITAAYANLLNRAPSASEAGFWNGFLAGPSAGPGTLSQDEQMIATILGFKEYFFNQTDSNGLHTNVAWVNSLYGSLGLPFDAAAADNTVRALIRSYADARAAAVQTILNSRDYITLTVTQDYQKYLRVAPSTPELNNWTAYFLNGGSRELEIATLLSFRLYFDQSPSVLNLTGQATTRTFVQAVYQDLFPYQTLDTATLNNWVALLNSGTISRYGFTSSLTTGVPYLFRIVDANDGVVNALYNRFLGVNVTGGQDGYWASIYPFGGGDNAIITSLLVTVDYFLANPPVKPHQFP